MIFRLISWLYQDERQRLEGTLSSDDLVGTRHSDSLYGLDGDDILDGLGGADALYGGSGDDALFGRAGNDALFGHAGRDLLIGGAGNDRIIDLDGPSGVSGGGGDDYIRISSGLAYGGNGSDTFDGFRSAEIFAGGGRDTIVAKGDHRGTANGGAGQDEFIIETVYSSHGRFNGDGGDDIFRVLRGSETFFYLDGGDGYDTVILDSEISVTGGAITSIEEIIGNEQRNQVRLSDGFARVDLKDGRDWMSVKNTQKSDHEIKLGDGNDLIFIENKTGHVLVKGGAGHDEINITKKSVGVIVRDDDGRDRVLIKGQAEVRLGADRDSVRYDSNGTGLDSYIHMGSGDDNATITGRAGLAFMGIGDDNLRLDTNAHGTFSLGSGRDTIQIEQADNIRATITDFNTSRDNFDIRAVESVDDLVRVRVTEAGLQVHVPYWDGEDRSSVVLLEGLERSDIGDLVFI